MIQVYSPTNTAYTTNGDVVLDAISCELPAELCGTWELDLVVPRDADDKWKSLVVGAVVAAPTFMGSKQLFRVYETEKGDEEVEAWARPIFFDSANDVFLLDCRPTQKTGQEALNILMAGTKYTGITDITTVNTAYYVRKNLIEAISGSDATTFMKRWGGEPLYNNFQIILNQRAGSDNGVQILYGKNISEIKEKVNADDLITRIVPIAYNGHMLEGETPWIDSPLIGAYPIMHVSLVRFENLKLAADVQGEPQSGDVVFDTLEELRAALITAAQDMYTNDQVDKPKVTLDINMVDLAQTEEYKDYSALETVSLGDTVHCRHSGLDITTDARVIGLTWDCIHNCISSVKIGAQQYDYFKQAEQAVNVIGNVVDTDGNVIGDRIVGTLNLLRANLRLQKDIAEEQSVRAILFEDLDPESPTFGALCIGTQGIEISHQRNLAGTDWAWGTAIDSQTIHAETMVSGIISDQQGLNYWDLDSGDFRLASTGVSIDGETINDYVANIAATTSNMSMHLTTEFAGVAPDADGYIDAETTAIIYYGQTDVTQQCEFSVTKTDGIEGSWDSTTKSYIATRLTTTSGTVRITAMYMGLMRITKEFTINRVTSGANGRAYQLDSTESIIRIIDQNGALSADSVTFSSYYFDGTSTNQKTYNGRFLIEHTTDGTNYETIYQSPENEHVVVHGLGSLLSDEDGLILSDDDGAMLLTGPVDVKEIRCTLYAAGGFSTVLGRRTIIFIRDAVALSPDDVFNILTDGGKLKGIYKSGNVLYINADYIGSGKLTSAQNPDNYWDLDTGQLSISSGTYINGSPSNTIGGMGTQITANANAITAEASARASADNDLSSRITINANAITSRVTANQVESMIEQSADSIRLKADKITWTATNSSLTEDGTLTAQNVNLTGAIRANTGYIGGTSGFTIAAKKLYSNGHSAYNTNVAGVYIGDDYISLGSGGVTYFKKDGTGKLGSWIVNGTKIYNGKSAIDSSDTGVYIGTDGIALGANNAFKVTRAGEITASGKITAQANSVIGPWNVSSTSIWRGKNTFGDATAGSIYFGTNGLSITDKFKVTGAGAITAAGTLTAKEGSKIGPWNVTSTSIWKGKSTYKDATEGSIYFGDSGISITNKFAVSKSGVLEASGAKISGTLTAGNGSKIGDLTISDGKLSVPAANISTNLSASQISTTTLSAITANLGDITAGSMKIGNNFTLKSDGSITAKSAVLQGSLSATSLSTGKKTSSTVANDGIYIDSAGNLYGGASNLIQLKANGAFTLGGSNGITYNGSGTINCGSSVRISGNAVTSGTISGPTFQTVSDKNTITISAGTIQCKRSSVNSGAIRPAAWGNNESYKGIQISADATYACMSYYTGSGYSAVFVANNGLPGYDKTNERAIIDSPVTRILHAAKIGSYLTTGTYLTVGTNATVNGNSTVKGTSTVNGNGTVKGTLTIGSTYTHTLTAGQYNLSLNKGLTVTNSLSVGGNATVTGNATVSGDATVSKNATVKGNSAVKGTLTIGNANTYTLTADVYDLKISKGLIIGNSAHAAGCVFRASGSAYIDDTLYADSAYITNTLSAQKVTERSDERQKDIANWEDIDSLILNMEPIRFSWKDDKTKKIHWGLGAQRTEKLLEKHGIHNTGFVTDSGKEYSIAYSELAPMMLPTVQQNRRRIEALERRIAELERTV